MHREVMEVIELLVLTGVPLIPMDRRLRQVKQTVSCSAGVMA